MNPANTHGHVYHRPEVIELPWRPVVPIAPTHDASRTRSGWVVYQITYRLDRAGVELDPALCWPWPGSRGPDGRARYCSDPERDTRLAWVMWREVRGPVPAGHEVALTCGTAACVNPNAGHMETRPRVGKAPRSSRPGLRRPADLGAPP